MGGECLPPPCRLSEGQTASAVWLKCRRRQGSSSSCSRRTAGTRSLLVGLPRRLRFAPSRQSRSRVLPAQRGTGPFGCCGCCGCCGRFDRSGCCDRCGCCGRLGCCGRHGCCGLLGRRGRCPTCRCLRCPIFLRHLLSIHLHDGDGRAVHACFLQSDGLGLLKRPCPSPTRFPCRCLCFQRQRRRPSSGDGWRRACLPSSCRLRRRLCHVRGGCQTWLRQTLPWAWLCFCLAERLARPRCCKPSLVFSICPLG